MEAIVIPDLTKIKLVLCIVNCNDLPSDAPVGAGGQAKSGGQTGADFSSGSTEICAGLLLSEVLCSKSICLPAGGEVQVK